MNITPLYTVIQSLYWSTYCIMFNYAASYLQDKGFSNSRTGLVLGICYALSALTQPLFASLIERTHVRLAKGIVAVYCVLAVLSLILLLPLGTPLLAVILTLALTLQHAMQSSVNALSHTLEKSGRLNFGFARGMGSALYAVIALLIGQLLRKISSAMLPAFYCATMLMLIVSLLRAARIGEASDISGGTARTSGLEPLRYPRFVLFLTGVIAMMMPHIFIDNFMLKIMQNVGGGNSELGIAICIAAVIEFPAMMLYGRLRKRFSCPALLGFAGIMWAIKHLLILTAKSPLAIYFCELLQFASFAFYVPAGVEFVSVALPERLYLRGQTMLGAFFAIGCLLAAMIGGSMLDAFGMTKTLMLFCASSVIGAGLFIAAGLYKEKVR